MRKPATRLIHHPYQPPAGFAAPQPGVQKASTVIFKDVAAMRARDWRSKAGYTYGLHGTPTSFVLEERIATLEGGEQCLLVPSGLMAVSTVGMALLKAGDEVLIPDNAYGPNKALAEGEFRHWGISHQVYDAMTPSDLEARIGPSTRLVWLEAPGSVTMEFPDLLELVRICRRKGVLCALDNTWGAGLALQAFDLGGAAAPGIGVDVSVHALTKYPSGGGDVLLGSIVTRDAALHTQIKLTHMRIGCGVGGMNDVETVLRALPSLPLRYRAQDRAAREVAAWCKSRPEIVQLLHPAFEGSPGHAHWQALCDDQAAGLFSVLFHERFAPARVDAFCDALRLFKLGYSWGGPMSLAVPYEVAKMRSAALGTWKHPGVLVRFSIGLEEPADLIADLEQAFQSLA
jgi:cystathionine beta-lyase